MQERTRTARCSCRDRHVRCTINTSRIEGLLKDWTELYASLIVGELTELSSITSLWAMACRRFRGYGSAPVMNRLGVKQVDARGRLSRAFSVVRVLATLAYHASRQVRTDIKLRRLVASQAQHRVGQTPFA